MDIFSRASSVFSRVVRAVRKEVSASWTSMWGDSTSDRVNPANFMANDKNWVYVCVDKIADSVSAIPIKLMKYNKNGEDTELFDVEPIDLLDKPSAQMTGRDFRYTTIAHLELTGNAYWLKDSDGQPTELFPLNPKNVTPKYADDGMSIVSFSYRAGTPTGAVKTVVYPASRIIHIKYPNPASPLMGRGTLEPIAEWVDVDNYATEFNRRFFQNSATFGGALETEATSEEAQAAVRMSLENNYRGLQNAHKLMVLPKGVKLVNRDVTPRDMQMQQADATFRDKILAAFGVPKSVVGIVEDVNRANAESSNYVFSAFTVKPKMDRLITYLNEFYLPLFKGSEQLYFTYADPTPENATLSIEESKASLAGAPWETPNEVRAKKGLAPVDGGDTLQSLVNMYPVGELPPAPNDPIAKSKKAPRIDKTDRASDLIAVKAFDLFKSGQDEAKHKAFVTRVSHYELELKKHFSSHDRSQKQGVLDKIRTLDLTKKIGPTELFDKEKEIEEIKTFALPVMKKLSKQEGERAAELVARAQVANLLKKSYSVSSRLLSILEASIGRMARSYTQTTLDLLIDTINNAIYDGKSLDEISDEVSKVYGLTDEYRAERVARTEVFSAANDASKDAYLESGVVKTMKWHTAEDERECEFCAPLNGKSIGVTESFFDKGDTVKGQEGGELPVDYETIENPPLHPQCRCYILPDVISIKSIADEKASDTEDDFWGALDKMLDE